MPDDTGKLKIEIKAMARAGEGLQTLARSFNLALKESMKSMSDAIKKDKDKDKESNDRVRVKLRELAEKSGRDTKYLEWLVEENLKKSSKVSGSGFQIPYTDIRPSDEPMNRRRLTVDKNGRPQVVSPDDARRLMEYYTNSNLELTLENWRDKLQGEFQDEDPNKPKPFNFADWLGDDVEKP